MSDFACSQQYHDASVWCCWRRSRRSDVEPDCTATCLQREQCTRMRCGTVLNAKSIVVSSANYGWTTDITWTILMMSLLPFWALNVSVAFLYMQGQKALRFHQKYLNCFLKMNEGLRVLERHEGVSHGWEGCFRKSYTVFTCFLRDTIQFYQTTPNTRVQRATSGFFLCYSLLFGKIIIVLVWIVLWASCIHSVR